MQHDEARFRRAPSAYLFSNMPRENMPAPPIFAPRLFHALLVLLLIARTYISFTPRVTSSQVSDDICLRTPTRLPYIINMIDAASRDI